MPFDAVKLRLSRFGMMHQSNHLHSQAGSAAFQRAKSRFVFICLTATPASLLSGGAHFFTSQGATVEAEVLNNLLNVAGAKAMSQAVTCQICGTCGQLLCLQGC